MPLAHLSKLTIFHSSQNVPGSASLSLPPCDVIYCFLFPSYVFLMDVSSRIEASLGSGFMAGRCWVHLAFWKRSSCSHLLVRSVVVQDVPQLLTTILVSYSPKSVLFEITGKQSKSAVGSLPLIFSFFLSVTISPQMLFLSCLLGLTLALPSESLWNCLPPFPNKRCLRNRCDAGIRGERNIIQKDCSPENKSVSIHWLYLQSLLRLLVVRETVR